MAAKQEKVEVAETPNTQPKQEKVEVAETPNTTNFEFEPIEETTEIEKPYVVFCLKEERPQGQLIMEGRCLNVLNPHTKKRDNLRLLRGVPTCWESEQKDLPKDYEKTNQLTVDFAANLISVPREEPHVIEFLRNHKQNINSVNFNAHSFHFYEYDTEVLAKEEEQKMQDQMKAGELAFSTKSEEIVKHLGYLGGNLIDEKTGFQKSPQSLKADYFQFSQKHPKKFLETYNSPFVNLTYVVKKAITDSKIDLHKVPGTAHWADGGFICTLTPKKNAATCIVEFAMSISNESKDFMNRLNAIQ
jgi:hypothetical protein